MPDELPPSGDKAVYLFLEMIALALVFAAIDARLGGKAWFISSSCLVLAIVFFWAGIKWPQIKAKTGTRISSSIDRIATDSRYRFGVALVFVACFGIYRIVYIDSLRRDLDMYVMPRTVTTQQADDLREFLSHHEAHTVTVKVNPLDEEAREYWGQLGSALSHTQWKVEMSTDNADPSTLNSGLCIGETGENGKPKDAPEHDPRELLQEALQAAHIESNCGGGSGAGEYKLFLLVGHRPLKIGDQEPTFRKLGRWIGRLGQ